MSTRSARGICLTPVLLGLIAGCGGNSGGGGTKGRGGGGGSPSTVNFSFSGGTPTVVAAKIGSGSFTLQSLTSGKLSLDVPAGTSNFAVAYLCTASAFPSFQSVFEASVADGTSFTLPCISPQNSDATGTLTGNVDASAIANANLINLAVGSTDKVFTAGISADTNFSLSVPAGNDRVEVLAYNNALSVPGSTSTLLAARNFTSQTVPGALNGGAQVVLGSSDATTSQTLAYSNVPSGYSAPSTEVAYVMSGQGGFSIATASNQYPVLPAGAVASGDYYAFFSTAVNNAKTSELTIVAKASPNPGSMSLSFPAPWSYAGPTPAALPTFNFSYAGFSERTGVFDTALLGWTTASSSFSEYQVIVSANYLNGSTTIAMPDLTEIAGFLPAPPSGTEMLWVGLIAEYSAGLPQPLSSNATIKTVENSGNYNVP